MVLWWAAHMLSGNFATKRVITLNNEANSLDPSAFLPQKNACMVEKMRMHDMTAKMEKMDVLNTQNCIRSIWTKTNTNSLHTNSIHSILRKIGHVIQIVVHQFVHKTSAEKNPKSEKNWSPFIPRYAWICKNSTKEKNMIPYKPYVRKKTRRINTRDLSHTWKQKHSIWIL